MNASAIMADWVSHKAYMGVYEAYKDQFAGFYGICCISADAAIAFTEEFSLYTPGEDCYWVEAVECFALQVFGYLQCGEVPSKSDFHLIAAGCIEKCKIR